MSTSQPAEIELFAFDWVPNIAKGHVRDLRARWAMEEAGIPYRSNLIKVADKPADFQGYQPFRQVPAIVDNGVRVFESGAILLHLGRKSEALLPRDAAGRAAAESWLMAAFNSVETFAFEIYFIHIFSAGEEWTALREPSATRFMKSRLAPVSEALGEKDYLTGRFTIADIAMATVFRDLDRHLPLKEWPNLEAYLKRCTERPAFERALASQIADFTGERPEGFPA
ncbi:MAG: glutathione S-transferase family protein [Pseudomonadota bacterium]|nr:glutathione S-transferase family protein [Pseudomonadota bacterium]